MKVGLLTSGGDCQGLNAALRGVAKTLYHTVDGVELYGILEGYRGLIEGEWERMEPGQFSGILTQGGTILGTSRQPFKYMQDPVEGSKDKLTMMLEHYKKGGFDALVILGGNGTHKTAHLLSQNGVNVVTMPKTIDNDLWGTDTTFGFHSAVSKAASVIDAVHTTAASHGRIFIVELMGHKVGWITLHAGMASGADVILLPEIPYDLDSVAGIVEERNQVRRGFTIIAIAEGALSREEARMSKKERKNGGSTSASRLADALNARLDQDVRTVVPGHFQRGGEPTATDRILCSRLGAKAGELLKNRQYGNMVAVRGDKIVALPLAETAGKLKYIDPDCEMLDQARLLGISFGDGRR